MKGQPWIGKPVMEVLFILLPPFASLLIIALFPALFQNGGELPEMGWVVLVLLIDVGHVYSTLYRTYFDPAALKTQRFLLWNIPFFSFIAGVLLYSVSPILFWRLLAYVAVFHFVRQQYGFMRVYSRKEPKQRWRTIIDRLTIYTAAIYPLLFWHLKGQRNFNWFLQGDFIYFKQEALIFPATLIYVIVLITYVVKECYFIFRYRYFNIPKAAIVWGTVLSWYFGIVYFNGDAAFTLLNVVSHGIPYMALIWLYGRKKYGLQKTGSSFLRLVFRGYGWMIFLAIIFLLAFIEEGIWDIAVWQEHKTIFGWSRFVQLNLGKQVLSFLVPLLVLPQITHYILDGFIWKIREEEFHWKKNAQ